MGALSATVLVGGMCAGAAAAGPAEQTDTKPQQTDAKSVEPDSKGNLIGATLGAVGALSRGHGSSQPVRAVLSVPKTVVGTVRNTTSGTVAGVSARLAPRGQPQKVPPPVAEPPPAAGPPPADPVVDAVVQAEAAPAPEIVVTVPLPAVPQVAPLPLPPVTPFPAVPGLPAPAAVTFAIPLPRIPFIPATVYAVDLTGPIVAFSTVQDTYETANTLVTDAVAPVNPFRGLAPAPAPEPQLKVYEREGITAETPAPIDVSGAPSHSGSAGMDDLGVVRIPMVTAAAVRLAPPRPFSEANPSSPSSPSSPSAATSLGLVGGGAAPVVGGAQGPVGGGATVRGSEARTGTQNAETPLSTTSPMANSPVRQGFPQYLRNARMVELTAVALPGLAGLLAITVSGGVIGYRQANSVRFLRTDADRFLT